MQSLGTNRRERTRTELVEHLESIAKDARELAEVWSKIYVELATTGQADLSVTLPVEVRAFINGPAQGTIYGRLEAFYKSASKVVGGRMDDEWRTTIFDCLGRLLYERRITKKSYVDALNTVRSKFVLSDTNHGIDWTDFTHAIEALRKEAAALDVLVASYKASL